MNARSTPSGITSALIEPCRKNCMSIADHVGTCWIPIRAGFSGSTPYAQSAIARKITVGQALRLPLRCFGKRSACPTTRFEPGVSIRRPGQLLFAGGPNDNRRNILRIDESIEVFCASKIGKMNDVVGDLGDFAAHFLSGSQV